MVALRRRSIFVGFGRIGELSLDGAHLLGGTVDLDPFTQRTGEIMASELYGRHAAGGIVVDVAIVHSDPRPGWEVSAVAIRRGLVLRGRSPEIVPWQDAKELFDAGPVAEQLTSLREMEPADLAAAVGQMPAARRGQLAAALDDEELADLLEELPEQDQVRLLDSLELERSADVVEEMQPDDAADLLAEMPAEQRERLLLAMRSVQADELRRLLLYDAKTAGGLMTSQPLVFTPDTPVAEVLARVRDKAQPATLAAQVYVCEPPAMTPTGRYLGSVGFQRLLRRAPSTSIGECVEARLFVRPEMPERELAARLAAYNLIGVAVCDPDGGCSARSPWTTCSTSCCRWTGGQGGPRHDDTVQPRAASASAATCRCRAARCRWAPGTTRTRSGGSRRRSRGSSAPAGSCSARRCW